jgi:hypothetical protein
MSYVKYTRQMLAEAVSASTSMAGVLRHLGLRLNGGAHAHLRRRITQLGIDTSHFLGCGHARGKRSPRRRRPDEILVASAAHRRGPGRGSPAGPAQGSDRRRRGTQNRLPSQSRLHAHAPLGDTGNTGAGTATTPHFHRRRAEVVAFALAHPTWGVRKMAGALRERAFAVSATSVENILCEAGLNTVRARSAASEAPRKHPTDYTLNNALP